MENLILTSKLCPGDMVMLSAAVRDLHAAHPGKFATDIRTPHPAIWSGNPLVTKLTEGREIEMHYPLVDRSNQGAYHFIHGYRMYLEEQLNVRIPAGAFHGDISLSAEERTTRPAGTPAAYWVIASGGKTDYTAKWWDTERWQAVVDYWTARGIAFVQVGGGGDIHPPLKGVTNLVGKTTLRQLICIVAHADGVLCPVTSLMHLAAALPMTDGRIRPCVVVAGGREPSHWERYPGHEFLDTIGQLPCCSNGGCWKSRVVAGIGGKLDESLCSRPIEIRPKVHIPECLNLITPARVIEAMARYMVMPKPHVVVPLIEPKSGCGNGCGKPTPESTDPRIFGPRRWREFHARPGTMEDATPLDTLKEAAWLGKFIASLPCEACRVHAAELLVKLPPDMSSRISYRRWGIAFHNGINKILGKPEMSIEEAEKTLASKIKKSVSQQHARHLVCSKCEHYGSGNGPLICKRDGKMLVSKTGTGDCEKWPGYVEPDAPRTGPKTTEVGLKMKATGIIGVVIGTYGAVPYIHLQLESLRRFHPGTPCLVVDDCSPQRDELAALCARYGAEFMCHTKRMGHVAGDLQIFVDGHEWARSRGIQFLVKFSRRWVPVAPWKEDLLRLHAQANAPTYSNRCQRWGFGFRSECVAMDVATWQAKDALAVLRGVIPTAIKQYVLAERFVHDAAGVAFTGKSPETADFIAKNPLHQGCGGYVPWALMGQSRHVIAAAFLWHETTSKDAYLNHLKQWGIDEYQQMDARPDGAIIVRRDGALGDVLCVTPILRQLRLEHPNIRIDVATACRDAVVGNPDIDGVFPPHHGNEGYSREINLNGAYEKTPTLHVVDAYAKRAGVVLSDKSLRITPEECEAPSGVVALHCAKSWESRTIPRATWQAVADHFIAQGRIVMALGGETDFCPAGALDKRRSFTISQVAFVISRAAVFIGSDSALLHVAGSTSVPIVGIYTCVRAEYREPRRKSSMFAAVTPALECYGCLADFTAPVTDLPECRRGDMACVREVKAAAIIAAAESIL